MKGDENKKETNEEDWHILNYEDKVTLVIVKRETAINVNTAIKVNMHIIVMFL